MKNTKNSCVFTNTNDLIDAYKKNKIELKVQSEQGNTLCNTRFHTIADFLFVYYPKSSMPLVQIEPTTSYFGFSFVKTGCSYAAAKTEKLLNIEDNGCMLWDFSQTIDCYKAEGSEAIEFYIPPDVLASRLPSSVHFGPDSKICSQGLGKLLQMQLFSYEQQLEYLDLSTSKYMLDQIVDLLCYWMTHYSLEKVSPSIRDILYYDIQDFISKNLDNQNLSLAYVADHFHISNRYIQLLFTTHNQTYSKMIINMRLKKCRNALIYTDLSITEIAYTCGFFDTSYFCKLFKKKYGDTPGNFRRLFK